MKKVLLHICCGVCALYCIEKLREDGFCPDGFFYNPNIHPYFEYVKRRRAAEIVAKSSGILLREGNYSIFDWFKLHKLRSQDSEGGARCKSCYQMRLKQTMLLLEQGNYDYFTTTLTISPHKESSAVFEIGRNIGRDKFLAIDFKKKDGFKKTISQARELGIYHQGYCGCVYSKNERAISLI